MGDQALADIGDLQVMGGVHEEICGRAGSIDEATRVQSHRSYSRDQLGTQLDTAER